MVIVTSVLQGAPGGPCMKRSSKVPCENLVKVPKMKILHDLAFVLAVLVPKVSCDGAHVISRCLYDPVESPMKIW